jgi:alkylhydroperoxidase family enzyme
VAAPVSVQKDQLTRLVALSPGDGRIAGLVRRVCGPTLSLSPLPARAEVGEPASEGEFAEQFGVDVSTITCEQRSRLWKQLGDATFDAVVQISLADFVPRVRAGVEALGVGSEYLGWVNGPITWDQETEPSDLVFNQFLPAVARMRALDPITSELVRLRGAAQHNCRLCKSSREGTALDADGTEELYCDIESYEDSPVLTERLKQRCAIPMG